MKANNFTPGPWVLNGASARIESINGDLIVVPLFLEKNNSGTVYGNGSSLANARLIAAAPELLIELEGAHNFLSVFLKNVPHGDWLDAINAGLISMKKAIYKAKGL